MKKILITLSFLLLTTTVYAEQWIKCIDTAIGSVNFEKPRRVSGDCLSLGLCSGANNTGLATNVFEVSGNEWNDASQSNIKCDRLASVGSRIINLTAQEIQDISDALASQADSALRVNAKNIYDGQTIEGQYLRCMADIIKKEINIVRQWTLDYKADVAVASNLSALKASVALLPDLNPRTLAQFKTSMKKCIDDGDVDE